MAFSQDRVDQAYKYWRLLPYYNRTERELQNALKRHGLVEVDARAYARDLIASADDLERLGRGLHPCYVTSDTEEGRHERTQARLQELCKKYGWKGQYGTFAWLEEQLEELLDLK